MVITRLVGGLGNQLFQYAFGRKVASQNGVPLKLDISCYDNNPSRKYGLKHFKVMESFASPEEIESVKAECSLVEPYEQFYTFNPQALLLPASVYLDGFWVNEKYFQGIEPWIRQEFSLKEELDPGNREMANLISASQSVALHIRRGDLLTDPLANQNLGVCPLEYYYRATKEIASFIPNPHFFVFSDDWDWFWALEIIKVNYQVTFVTLNREADCHKDLYLMSLCKHHIIANSTFSWWGAWLAPDPQKMIIAPEKWAATDDLNTLDVTPPAWRRM